MAGYDRRPLPADYPLDYERPIVDDLVVDGTPILTAPAASTNAAPSTKAQQQALWDGDPRVQGFPDPASAFSENFPFAGPGQEVFRALRLAQIGGRPGRRFNPGEVPWFRMRYKQASAANALSLLPGQQLLQPAPPLFFVPPEEEEKVDTDEDGYYSDN